MIFYLMILVDFMLLLYIYVGTQWVGWSLEETLGSKAGFALLVFAAFLIIKNGLKIKPRLFSRTMIILGIAILLSGYAFSLQFRHSINMVIVEGEVLELQDRSITLKRVTAEDSPGVIRNDVHADVDFMGGGSGEVTQAGALRNQRINIMPKRLKDGNFWRIVRFGYAPSFDLIKDGKVVLENRSLVLSAENWSSDLEQLVTSAGLLRKPPPRVMLGVGAFPPEMEAAINFTNIDKEVDKLIERDDDKYLFMRLSKAEINGSTVSLEADDYWRYVTQGRLEKPYLKFYAIKKNRITKAQELTFGETFHIDDKALRFSGLNYWVELEQRKDPFILLILASFLIIYTGILILTVQLISRKMRRVFKGS